MSKILKYCIGIITASTITTMVPISQVIGMEEQQDQLDITKPFLECQEKALSFTDGSLEYYMRIAGHFFGDRNRSSITVTCNDNIVAFTSNIPTAQQVILEYNRQTQQWSVGGRVDKKIAPLPVTVDESGQLLFQKKFAISAAQDGRHALCFNGIAVSSKTLSVCQEISSSLNMQLHLLESRRMDIFRYIHNATMYIISIALQEEDRSPRMPYLSHVLLWLNNWCVNRKSIYLSEFRQLLDHLDELCNSTPEKLATTDWRENKDHVEFDNADVKKHYITRLVQNSQQMLASASKYLSDARIKENLELAQPSIVLLETLIASPAGMIFMGLERLLLKHSMDSNSCFFRKPTNFAFLGNPVLIYIFRQLNKYCDILSSTTRYLIDKEDREKYNEHQLLEAVYNLYCSLLNKDSDMARRTYRTTAYKHWIPILLKERYGSSIPPQPMSRVMQRILSSTGLFHRNIQISNLDGAFEKAKILIKVTKDISPNVKVNVATFVFDANTDTPRLLAYYKIVDQFNVKYKLKDMVDLEYENDEIYLLGCLLSWQGDCLTLRIEQDLRKTVELQLTNAMLINLGATQKYIKVYASLREYFNREPNMKKCYLIALADYANNGALVRFEDVHEMILQACEYQIMHGQEIDWEGYIIMLNALGDRDINDIQENIISAYKTYQTKVCTLETLEQDLSQVRSREDLLPKMQRCMDEIEEMRASLPNIFNTYQEAMEKMRAQYILETDEMVTGTSQRALGNGE